MTIDLVVKFAVGFIVQKKSYNGTDSAIIKSNGAHMKKFVWRDARVSRLSCFTHLFLQQNIEGGTVPHRRARWTRRTLPSSNGATFRGFRLWRFGPAPRKQEAERTVPQ